MGSIINNTLIKDILPGKHVIGVQIVKIGPPVFAQLTADRPFTLEWAAHPASPQNCPYPRGMWTPSNTWFLERTQVLNKNGISIALAVFAGLM